MPPSATLPQNAPETAVGRSVKARNVVGSTPSVATYFPLTLIRAASIRPAATTPGTRRTAASVPAGSDVPETTRTSAASSLPGGEVMAASGDEDARGSGSAPPKGAQTFQMGPGGATVCQNGKCSNAAGQKIDHLSSAGYTSISQSKVAAVAKLKDVKAAVGGLTLSDNSISI